jgi:CspA family cold shock protein
MVEGTVKFFNVKKNFGFISGDDGTDYFVHRTGVEDGKVIKDGDRVSFDVVEGDRGPKADHVKKV